MKKIVFLGPAWPYRGGIATIIETLARTFRGRGAAVEILTFSIQYPGWLFPGRSQFRGGQKPEDLTITRAVNTINPFNWIRVGLRIRRARPDAVILKYWTPFMAPCFGTIARVAKWGRAKKTRFGDQKSDSTDPKTGLVRRNKHTKFIVQLDNIVPHERRWFDSMLTRFFVGSMDGFIYMSGEVGRQLAEFDTVRPRLYSPHPLFDHFGEPLSRDVAAARLGLDPEAEYLLFFGFVRPYKGLDLLLEAFAKVITNCGEATQHTAAPSGGLTLHTCPRTPPAGVVPPRPARKLIIAGEFYEDAAPYRAQIERLGLSNDVVLHDRFIGDDEIPAYFSLAEALVLPYKTATQSGVTQIAYHFDVPMIVTNVGGLPEIVDDGVTGFVCPPTVEGLVGAIEKMSEPGVIERLRTNFPAAKARFSWDAAADAIEEVYSKLKVEN